MTREEAIVHIKDVICENNTIKPNIVVFEQEKEALYMAIKALEQEPNCSEIPTGSTTKNDLGVETTQMIDKSNFSQEQYKSDLQSAYDCGYAQAKNDLGVDCISRQAVIDLMMQKWGENFSGDDAMQESIDAIRELPPVTPQEPQSFKWCTDCKEYDQEKHCCHRYSKVIRNTVAEIRQEPKTGHWIGIDEEPHEDYECDKCGYIISTYTANIEPHTEYKYCPNCGAKMVVPQESEG